MSTKMTPEALTVGLAHFIGTENYTRSGLMRDLLMTDGVKFLADNAGAHWLVDVVASHLMTNAKLRGEEFQSWDLKATPREGANHAAVVWATDGNETELIRQEIEFTDFPLDEIKLFCAKAPEFGDRAWVLMLPGEY